MLPEFVQAREALMREQLKMVVGGVETGLQGMGRDPPAVASRVASEDAGRSHAFQNGTWRNVEEWPDEVLDAGDVGMGMRSGADNLRRRYSCASAEDTIGSKPEFAAS